MSIEPAAMTSEQVEQFLAEPRNAVLGTTRKDGSPQLSAIWFTYRDGLIYTSMYKGSAKYYNIRRDPRIVLCVNAAHPDARSVTIFGHAEFITSDTRLYEQLSREIALNYHDTAEEAEAYLGVAEEGEVAAVVLTPTKIISQDYNNSV